MSTIGPTIDYDVVFESSGGLRLGAMLADSVDDKGRVFGKQWRAEEIPLPTHLRVAERGANLSDLPPEMAATVFQDDHSGGLGESRLTGSTAKYYTGSVATISGKAFKPPFSEEITLPTSEGTVDVFFEFSGRVYVSDGRYLHRSDATGLNFTQVLDVGAGKTITSGVVFGATTGDTYILIFGESTSGTPFDYYMSLTGASGSWQQRKATAGSGGQKAFVRDDTLFILTNPNLMYTTQNPTNSGTIAGPTEVGDKSSNFQGGNVVFAYLLIRKTDAVYYVDASSNVGTLIESFQRQPDANNFTWAVAGDGGLWYTTLDDDVWVYDPWAGSVDTLDIRKLPDSIMGGLTSSHHHDGLTFDGSALFALHHTSLLPTGHNIIRMVRDGTTYHIDRWLHQTASGYRPQGPLYATRIFGTRQLYFATTTAGIIGRLNLFASADPTLDTSARYAAGTQILRTGWMVHEFPAEVKDYTEITVEASQVTQIPPTSTIAVYYYRDGDEAASTLVGTVDHTGATVFHLGGVSGTSFMLEFQFSSDGPAYTPVLLSWSIKAAVKFPQRDRITLVVRCADGLKNRRGSKSEYTAQLTRRLLRQLRNVQNETITYKDFAGQTFADVKILPGRSEQVVIDHTTGTVESLITIQVLRVSEDIENEFIIGADVVGGRAVIGD